MQDCIFIPKFLSHDCYIIECDLILSKSWNRINLQFQNGKMDYVIDNNFINSLD